MLFQLIYASRANPLQAEEVMNLLQDARQNNQKRGITGLLLYGQELFLQVLEGERDAVNELFRAIVADERHNDVTILEARNISARDFSAWAMGSIGWPDELDNRTRSTLRHTIGQESLDLSRITGEEVVLLFKSLVSKGYMAHNM